ncbi:MAG: hypothetical protein ABIP29_00090 [Candidatus Eisenbacteria bacterium]
MTQVPSSLVLSALLVLAAGCSENRPAGGTPGPGGPVDAEFVIQPGAFNQGMMAFVPARDTVQVGQKVRLRNSDSIVHRIDTLTAGGPSWGQLGPGNFNDATVATAGTFTFECKIGGHTMSGILVVAP